MKEGCSLFRIFNWLKFFLSNFWDFQLKILTEKKAREIKTRKRLKIELVSLMIETGGLQIWKRGHLESPNSSRQKPKLFGKVYRENKSDPMEILENLKFKNWKFELVRPYSLVKSLYTMCTLRTVMPGLVIHLLVKLNSRGRPSASLPKWKTQL